MPRTARIAPGGVIYHALNRGHGRRRLFNTHRDYQAFLEVLALACQRFPGVRLLAFCLMPNHWHLVLWPAEDGELARFMRWLTQTHTQRWRHAKRTVGHGALYQGRYRSFPVQDDEHFLMLCRYVERNALAATLADPAEAWPWGSAYARRHPKEPTVTVLADWPVARPSNWARLLNERPAEADASAVQASLARGRPLGDAAWVAGIAHRLGLSHTLRPPGRPRRGAAADVAADVQLGALSTCAEN
jgi:putative transposase